MPGLGKAILRQPMIRIMMHKIELGGFRFRVQSHHDLRRLVLDKHFFALCQVENVKKAMMYGVF